MTTYKKFRAAFIKAEPLLKNWGSILISTSVTYSICGMIYDDISAVIAGAIIVIPSFLLSGIGLCIDEEKKKDDMGEYIDNFIKEGS